MFFIFTIISLTLGVFSVHAFSGENKPDLNDCKGLVLFSKTVDDFNIKIDKFKKTHSIVDAYKMVKSSYWCDMKDKTYAGYMVVRHYNVLGFIGAEYLVDIEDDITESTIIELGMCGIPQDIASNLLNRAYSKKFAKYDMEMYIKGLRSKMKKCGIDE